MKLAGVAFALLGSAVSAAPGAVVVTGATGRLGSMVYGLMKSRDHDVRALVRNATKAKDVLKCSKCDSSEGIFEGDITDVESMKEVMAGASALMIVTSATPSFVDGKLVFHKGAEPIDIDWHGAKNQLQAFAERQAPAGNGQVALISTAGTETPEDPKGQYFMDYIGFYKLNFEAALMSSGLPYTIIKPCGLDYDGTDPGEHMLVTGHDGSINVSPPSIARADVARVMVAAIENPEAGTELRFDLCATKDGKPTTDADLVAVLKTARYPWQTTDPTVVV
jgi:uncharacterized protein YbjT (DUF2867 family)